MDIRDSRILAELDTNPKIPVSQLARKMRISQQVADYRIKRLQQEGIITGFHTVINPLAIGFRLFRISIWFSKISSELRTVVLAHIQKQEGVAWAGFTNSHWDLIIDFYAKKSRDAESFIKRLIGTFKTINRYEINELRSVIEKNYSYLSKRTKAISIEEKEFVIDELSHHILRHISTNCRISLVDIYKKTKISIPTIRERIKRMEKQEIIGGYRLFIDPRKLLRESYKIFFSLENQALNDIDAIRNFGLGHDAITYIAQYFGNYFIDFEIEVSNKEELQTIIIELRNKYPLRDIHIVSILSDIALNHYPFTKLNS